MVLRAMLPEYVAVTHWASVAAAVVSAQVEVSPALVAVVAMATAPVISALPAVGDADGIATFTVTLCSVTVETEGMTARREGANGKGRGARCGCVWRGRVGDRFDSAARAGLTAGVGRVERVVGRDADAVGAGEDLHLDVAFHAARVDGECGVGDALAGDRVEAFVVGAGLWRVHGDERRPVAHAQQVRVDHLNVVRGRVRGWHGDVHVGRR